MPAQKPNLHQSYLDFSVEWQTFVGRRLSEDFHLLQELSAAKAPDQVWNCVVKVLAGNRRGLRQGIFHHGKARGQLRPKHRASQTA
jgi:hypothetical protein